MRSVKIAWVVCFFYGDNITTSKICPQICALLHFLPQVGTDDHTMNLKRL